MKSAGVWLKEVKAIDRANASKIDGFATEDGSYFAAGRRVSIRIELDYEVPVETLFAVFTNLEIAAKTHWPIRLYHLRSSPDSTDPFGPGSERGIGPVRFLRYRERILEKIENQRLAWTVIGRAPVKEQLGAMDFASLGPHRSRMVETVTMKVPLAMAAPLVAKETWRLNLLAFLRVQTLLQQDPSFHLGVVPLLRN